MTFLQHNLLKAAAPLLFLMVLLAVASCAPRPGSEVLSIVPQDETSPRQVSITVATNRARNAATGGYSDARAPTLNYEAFTISIPPNHEVTQIEWPKAAPDPKTSFVVTDRKVLPALALAASPSRSPASGTRDILIFVHGYNYNFAESLFRLAQIVADANLREKPILFAWPSAASATGYVADKDAVTYSRDDLVSLLTSVAGDPKIGNITLFGHSMGGWLVAEALRQLRLTGQDRVIERLGDVVLAAPDIDIDVFHRQVQIIGALTPPMTVLVSPDDRALMISGRLAGSRNRVGSADANDPRVQALAAANGIQVIDISNLEALDGSNHNRFAALVKVIPRMADAKLSSLAQAGAFILEPISATLVPSYQ